MDVDLTTGYCRAVKPTPVAADIVDQLSNICSGLTPALDVGKLFVYF